MGYKNGVAYPKYAHNEKLSTKVREEDIPVLRDMFFIEGKSKSAIARHFNISRATVSYWLKDDEGRDAENKKRNKRSKKGYVPEQHQKFLARKKDLKKEETLDYKNSVNRAYRKNHVDEIRKKDRIYRQAKRAAA